MTSSQKLDPYRVDDTRMLVNEFESDISLAQSEGRESIEATEQIINHFNKKGLKGSSYFIYKGIKVYPLGKTEEIESEESIPATEKMHGTSDGTVNRLDGRKDDHA